MERRYYLIDSNIVTQNYKQHKEGVSIPEADLDKFLLCAESPFTEIAHVQYGVTEDVSKILYTKVPLSLEDSTDSLLDATKYITNKKEIFKIVNYEKEYSSSMIYYIISVDEVND